VRGTGGGRCVSSLMERKARGDSGAEEEREGGKEREERGETKDERFT